MHKTLLTTLAAACLLAALPASAGDSRGANPHELKFTDIEMDLPDYDEPFRRDGRLVAPERLAGIVPGASTAQVRELIGEPLRTGHGRRGPEWDYNLKLGLADHDYIVCQYKVVLDARGETVVETAWRRYQCRDAMAAHQAHAGG